MAPRTMSGRRRRRSEGSPSGITGGCGSPCSARRSTPLSVMARGLRPVLRLTYTRLDLTDTHRGDGDPAEGDLAELAAPDGYRLVAWRGVVPDDLAETFAAARPAMDHPATASPRPTKSRTPTRAH